MVRTMPDALLKLLVKDKPLHSGKVRERETKPQRNEVRAVENTEKRTEDNYTDKDEPARKVSS